jgi:phosphoserine phosphatase
MDESRKIEDLLQVLDITRRLAVTPDLESLLLRIEEAALGVLDCERATVYVHDPVTDELVSRVATGLRELRFPADRGIAGECFRTGEVILVEDAYADPRFNRAVDKETGFRTRNILTCPLTRHDGGSVGVLQVLNKTAESFSPWDETLLLTLGAQCGVALQRQALLSEFAGKQRIQRELSIAREIQQGLLPREPLVITGVEVAGRSHPAQETGGDFYTWQRVAGERHVVTLADVSGHGVSAALVAAQCHALLRSAFSSLPAGKGVASAVDIVSGLLREDIPEDRFVTLVSVLIDRGGRGLRVCSAGHGPLLLFRSGGGPIELPVHAMPLGIEPLAITSEERVDLEPGDCLVLLTDGLLERRSPAGEPFGIEGVSRVVHTLGCATATEIVTGLHLAAAVHARGSEPRDDLTVVVLLGT